MCACVCEERERERVEDAEIRGQVQVPQFALRGSKARPTKGEPQRPRQRAASTAKRLFQEMEKWQTAHGFDCDGGAKNMLSKKAEIHKRYPSEKRHIIFSYSAPAPTQFYKNASHHHTSSIPNLIKSNQTPPFFLSFRSFRFKPCEVDTRKG